ncbi:hypothetical protein K3495_g2047 [Podosphaera aphanis]|nr:hypothetical protein K3495_g2047 [Podosphaera aphanis]
MNRSNQISDLANGDELMFENNYEDTTFIPSPLTSQQLHNTPTVRSQDQPVWNKKEMIHKNRLQKFTLMHRRLGHVSSTAISKVHNVTTLKRPIIVPQMLPKCEVCVKANIKNRFSKKLSPHQAKHLAILSVDIAGPFPTSIRGNSYFAEVIDSWSRKVWIIPIAKKSDLPAKLNELSIVLERQSGEEILAGRSDGAPEILKLFGVWKSKRGIVPQTTAPYSSNQNGMAERAIQTSEKEARALLEDSNMSVEFWDYAVESGAYVRNRLQRGPWIENEREGKIVHRQISPEGAWTGTYSQDIDHLRVWGCQAIPYVDIRSMPGHARTDKLVPRGRKAVFVGYVDETTKQWKMWAPDLRRVVVVKRAEFFEDKCGGSLDLNLRLELSNGRLISGNGTPYCMPERNPRGRPANYSVLPRQLKRKFTGVEHLANKPDSEEDINTWCQKKPQFSE